MHIKASGALVALLLPVFGALAAPMVKTEHVEAELVSDRASAMPGVATLVGLKLRMAEHWHTDRKSVV